MLLGLHLDGCFIVNTQDNHPAGKEAVAVAARGDETDPALFGQRDGAVKLTRRGRDDPSMDQCPSSFSRHTSPHSTHGTNAFSANGNAPPATDVDQLGRGSARRHA
jgi:hypothetical protein